MSNFIEHEAFGIINKNSITSIRKKDQKECPDKWPLEIALDFGSITINIYFDTEAEREGFYIWLKKKLT